MKILKYLLYGIAAIIILVLVAALIMPKEYTVERSITINAPKQVIMEQVKSHKNRNKWSPWAEYDPNMKLQYEGNDGEVGSISRWEGNKDVGKGWQQIQSITENRVEDSVHFVEPWEGHSKDFVQVDPEGQAQKVTWGFSGRNPFPMNIMIPFMDGMLGKDFDKGLNKLKAICEGK